MAAFHGAVAAGAHALETDLHLSRDGVVVLSHVSIPCKPQTTRLVPLPVLVHLHRVITACDNNG